MFKNIMKGFTVAAFALSITLAPFVSSKASAAVAGETIQTCRWKRVVLNYGSTGNCVKLVQSYLNEARLLHIWRNNNDPNHPDYNMTNWSEIAVDGIYGNATKWTVGVYQGTTDDPKYGLPADGIVGDRTWETMQIQCVNKFPQYWWGTYISQSCH